MKITKRRLLLAILIVLLLVSTLYHLGPGFFGRKSQGEKEALLVRRHIGQPTQPIQVEGGEMAVDLEEAESSPPVTVTPQREPVVTVVEKAGEEEGREAEAMDEEGVVEPASAPEIPQEDRREARSKRLEVTIRKLEQELLKKEGKIGDWERRWREKGREAERYRRELMALKKEAARKEQLPREEKPRVKVERVEFGGKKAQPRIPDKPVEAPPGLPSPAECQGVPLSHRNVALFFCQGLNLGGDLSYSEAVMALQGLGISPGVGWNEGDPSFPIWTEELEEILSEAKRAVSTGLVATDYSGLEEKLRDYCRRERVQLSETPLCEGPMVTECDECEISHGEFAVYLCKVLGIGEDLNYAQAFLTLGALRIFPRRGWRFENPSTRITPTEIEEVRCSVAEASQRGYIEASPNIMVASLNDYCIWLRMNIQVVGGGTVADTVATKDYQSGGGGGTVKSASQ
jgi:hypothetical protein